MRSHIIDENMNRGMNKFIIYIGYPSLILYRMANLKIEEAILEKFIITIVISLILFLGLAIYAYTYIKIKKYNYEEKPILEFAIFAPNNGFLGFPITFTLFGDLGLIYMIACNLSLNIMFFTYGIKLMKRGKEHNNTSIINKIFKFIFILLNPKILAAVIGLFLSYNQLLIPKIVGSYLSMIGDIATPMAMIFIGGSLVNCRIRDIVKNREIIDVLFNKLFIVPIISLGFMSFMPLDPLIKVIIILCNAIPVATTVSVFSEQYDRNQKKASEIIFVTTVISMFSIPFWLLILSKVFSI